LGEREREQRQRERESWAIGDEREERGERIVFLLLE
jgi:hypothetical protein